MPRNAAEAKGLLVASIREPDPVIFLEPKALYRTSVENVPDGDYEVPLGTADVMRTGADVTLVRTTLSSVPSGKRSPRLRMVTVVRCSTRCGSDCWKILVSGVLRRPILTLPVNTDPWLICCGVYYYSSTSRRFYRLSWVADEHARMGTNMQGCGRTCTEAQ